MSKPSTTPPRNNHALVLALETLNDEAAALRAELTFAHAEAEAYRDLAVTALAELHDALIARDQVIVERDELRAALESQSSLEEVAS